MWGHLPNAIDQRQPRDRSPYGEWPLFFGDSLRVLDERPKERAGAPRLKRGAASRTIGRTLAVDLRATGRGPRPVCCVRCRLGPGGRERGARARQDCFRVRLWPHRHSG